MTWPLVRVTAVGAFELTDKVLAPVVIAPLVRVNTPVRVLEKGRLRPPVLLTVRLEGPLDEGNSNAVAVWIEVPA